MNTYLIISETIYHTNLALKDLTQNIQNIITFNLDENTLDEVLTEASYFSMFEDQKCLIVKNARFFLATKTGETKKSKEDADKLLKYLENENKNTKLIFICNTKPDSKKKIYNLLKENGNLINYPAMTKTEMKNELLKIVEANKYKIEDRSLWYIINNSLGNFDLAVNEINKIMTFYSNKGDIKYNDVLGLTSKTIEENNFKLVDSIITRDLNMALNYLEEAKRLKVEPSIIMALIYREFKLMLSVLLLEENKFSKNEIMSNLKLAEWQIQKIKDNLHLYRKKEIEEEIIKLGNLDYQYKSGLINKDILLITYIIDLCI